MRKAWVMMLGLGMALALTTMADAGERKGKRERPQRQRAMGELKSAELKDGKIEWTITMAEPAEDKTFEMKSEVVVMYAERGGKNRAMRISAKGKKVPESKGKRLVAAGTFQKAEAVGKRVEVTIKTDDGKDLSVVLPTNVTVMYIERGDGSRVALGIGPGRRTRGPRQEGERPKRRRKKEQGGEGAPANM